MRPGEQDPLVQPRVTTWIRRSENLRSAAQTERETGPTRSSQKLTALVAYPAQTACAL